jgi:serine/threonine protein kinase
MAPEILNGKGHTRSVDWYLLGVVVYEMLVGVPPYYSDDKT